MKTTHRHRQNLLATALVAAALFSAIAPAQAADKMGDNIWIYIPICGKVRQFLGTIPGYPFQEAAGGNPASINYNSL